MIGFVWKVLTSKPMAIAAVGASFFLGVKLGIVEWHYHTTQKELAAKIQEIEAPDTGYIARLSQCHVNTALLESKIGDQNRRIDALKTAADAAAARGQAEIEKAKGEIAAHLSRAERIAATIPSSKDLCVAAHDLIRRTLAEERK